MATLSQKNVATTIGMITIRDMVRMLGRLSTVTPQEPGGC
jgi:hypothetical protein